jgi:hypothetical protein
MSEWFSWIDDGNVQNTVRVAEVVALRESTGSIPSTVFIHGGIQLAIGAADVPKLKAALRMPK